MLTLNQGINFWITSKWGQYMIISKRRIPLMSFQTQNHSQRQSANIFYIILRNNSNLIFTHNNIAFDFCIFLYSKKSRYVSSLSYLLISKILFWALFPNALYNVHFLPWKIVFFKIYCDKLSILMQNRLET